MNIATVIDDPKLHALLEDALGRGGHFLARSASVEEALRRGVEVVFAEWPSQRSAAPLLDGIRASQLYQPAVPVVVFVAEGALVSSSRAIGAGAADVLFKPSEPAEISAEIEGLSRNEEVLLPDKRLVLEEFLRTHLIGETPQFRRCVTEMQRAAACDANVLLQGETGTGKEMLARAIHQLSRRAEEPYVAINCAGLPGDLLESELFGHVKGAFTGANQSREGRFGSVGAGTLLLDEIGDIELRLQIKLLRVIETKRFERVGENRSVEFAGRLVSATSVDLREAMKAGRFRSDLMGRIDQFEITLPPLRDRSADIPMLARHFVRKHSRGLPVKISASSMSLLNSGDYPMNVRQLENAIIGGVARCNPGTLILAKHLPAGLLRSETRRKGDDYIIQVPQSGDYGRESGGG